MTCILRSISRIVFNNQKRNFCTKADTKRDLNVVLSSIYAEDMENLKKRYNSFEGTRYNGRIKRRKWEDRNKSEEQVEENPERVPGEPFERIKRRKSIILLSYLGADYYGMQRNPNMKTIEEDLLQALFKTNHILDDGFKQMQQIQFQRAARTDKGVSAAMQIVSLKLPDAVDIEQINNNLPPEIRVFGIKRVTKGFNSKSQCDARTYTYLIPTFAFEDHTKLIEDHSAYRVSSEKIDVVNTVLKCFEGTRNFHNFTSRKKYLDPSSRRYIMSFTCGEPFILGDLEYAVIKVKGQSFMMHQIRKMVGLTLAIVRGHAPKETIELTWTPDGYDIPTAPGLGLVLDEIHYDRYNKRYGSDGIHEPLTWDDIRDKLDTFKKDVIYNNIAKQEKAEMGLSSWLETLPLHSYSIRTDGPPKDEEDYGNDDDSDGEDVDEDYEKKDLTEVNKTVSQSVVKSDADTKELDNSLDKPSESDKLKDTKELGKPSESDNLKELQN